MKLELMHYDDQRHRSEVVEVLQTCFDYTTARNNPELSIEKKLAVNDDLFFVAVEDEKVVGMVMGGYDGHRGWIYSLAVLPEKRKAGIGSRLLDHAEKEIARLGCVKINLQIVTGNEHLIDFYGSRGFAVEERISMGKEIPENI